MILGIGIGLAIGFLIGWIVTEIKYRKFNLWITQEIDKVILSLEDYKNQQEPD